MAALPVLPPSDPFLVEGDPIRLDVFLVAKTGRSRMFLKEQIELGNIQVNGSPVTKTGLKVRSGDQVSCLFTEQAPLDLEPIEGHLSILFEDEHLIVLNKRQGDVVHPAPGHQGETLVHYLLHHMRHDPKFAASDTDRPGIVHRLDRGTSGVMLVAKTRGIQEALSKLFKDRLVKKEYEAVVWGKPPDRGVWKSEIGRDTKNRKKMSSRTSKGRASVTHFERRRLFQHFAHLALFPHTGRTHQIRVHVTEAGYPIVGDPLYGRGTTPARLRGLDHGVAGTAAAITETLLHARALSFEHPVTKAPLRFEAPRPETFENFLSLLERMDA